MLGVRGFQNGCENVLVVFIDEIDFGFHDLAVSHAEGDRAAEKRFEILDSHAIWCAMHIMR